MFKCDKCKEEFIEDEMIFMCGDVMITDIERYDYDTQLCGYCYEKMENISDDLADWKVTAIFNSFSVKEFIVKNYWLTDISEKIEEHMKRNHYSVCTILKIEREGDYSFIEELI